MSELIWVSMEKPVDPSELGALRWSLGAEGIRSAVVPWSSADFDWASAPLCILRATWDYPQRLEEFLAWLPRVPRLLNPPRVVAWNADKHYLVDLERRGVPVVPTVWLPRGRPLAPLEAVLAMEGWSKAVLKPVVSGGAWNTVCVEPASARKAEATLEAIHRDRDAMLQPYLPAVEGEGEISVVMIDGKPSHALRRAPVLLDGHYGGQGIPLTQELVDFAERALAAASKETLLYARVDVIRDEAGTLRLMELELIEPFLYLHTHPAALGTFTRAVAQRL